jgi:uroporphyrinogen decarboxylase
MNQRENLLSLLRREGYEKAPVEFRLSPPMTEEYKKRAPPGSSYQDFFEIPWRYIPDGDLGPVDTSRFEGYFDCELKPGTRIDYWGVAHEPGSEAALHMTRMRHPLRGASSPEEILEYPFPDFGEADFSRQSAEVSSLRARGLASVGFMQRTVWESSWYIRGMEELMLDMMDGDPKATILLDKVTEIATLRAEAYARAGVDILYLGDDVGTQRGALMSEELYVEWLKPRLKKVIRAAKAIRPELIVFYHSCGLATAFIPHLIEAGIDVMNPIQPECMDFKEIHEAYGDRLTFHGTIGTQVTMPFGSPEDVRREVFKNLEIAGDRGGLFAAPTHTLEPGVPWDNLLAYAKACRDFK